MKQETYYCDIEDCKNTDENIAILSGEMDVIFTTDDNGSLCKPYFETVELDICEECHNKILKSGKYIQATKSGDDYKFVITK